MHFSATTRLIELDVQSFYSKDMPLANILRENFENFINNREEKLKIIKEIEELNKGFDHDNSNDKQKHINFFKKRAELLSQLSLLGLAYLDYFQMISLVDLKDKESVKYFDGPPFETTLKNTKLSIENRTSLINVYVGLLIKNDDYKNAIKWQDCLCKVLISNNSPKLQTTLQKKEKIISEYIEILKRDNSYQEAFDLQDKLYAQYYDLKLWPKANEAAGKYLELYEYFKKT